MREIKFRAWDKARPHPCMIEIECVMYDEFDKMSISGKPFDKDNGGFTHLEEGDFELMQFTGLKDKNGVDIYEGDIIKAYHSEWGGFDTAEVKYESCTFTIGRYWKDGVHDWISMEQYEPYDMDVIGNVHQNPELLTGLNEVSA